MATILGDAFSWMPDFLGVNWELGTVEDRKLRTEDYSFGFHLSHWVRPNRNIPVSYGIEEGFRAKNEGIEFFFHIQSSVVLKKLLVVGINAGPVVRTTDQNPVDLELNLWTGALILLNVRLPSVIKFPANTISRSPVIGLTLAYPLKYDR